jgi:choline dehydrogenase-like flavoprotein
MRLEPDDLAARPWIPGSGWPLPWRELETYYPRALAGLDLPPDALDRDVFDLFRIEPPAFDANRLRTTFSAFSPVPDRGRALLPRLRSASQVRVLLDATAVSLTADEAGRRVARVELCAPGGGRSSVLPRAVVLCCGGIDNARLLLASGDPGRGGLANAHDVVGRFFQDHVAFRAGTLETPDARRLQTLFGVFSRKHVRHHPKLVLPRAVRERAEILACGATVAFELPEGSGVAAGLRVARQLRARRWPSRLPSEAWLVVRDLPGIAGSLPRFARGLSPTFAPTRIELLLVSEQAPNHASRVTLAEKVDRFGVPRARVEWRLTELEHRTMLATAGVVGEELEAAGLGSFRPLPELAAFEPWAVNAFDTFHHTGSTRMADDAGHGVVDADCRVHGLANLFVAGSSVFPTSGFAHPTLTLVALAIRLADRLRTELAG